MNRPAVKKRKPNNLALAFAIPLLGMLIFMAIRTFEPFGDLTMLYSDMYYQYFPFFVAFRGALRKGTGLLYNWSVGMGVDYLGLISYYLASPLNLLSVLVPEGWLLEYFALLVPLKLGLAGLFFALFLKKIFERDDFSIALFGTFYALCAWALGYQWNVMWLDTFALLPLVALGTVALLRDKKFFLYTVTLFLSVYANYYIGFFTCIFVFLSFFCYEICRFRGFKRLLADFVRIGFFSVLAIGMTAILELPALAALQNTYSSVNNFPKEFTLNIADENTWRGLLSAMRTVAGNMAGGVETTFMEGLPNLYCGVGTVILAFLFLTSGEVKLRDKVCSVLLLLFFMVSFIIRKLDYIWHGFHFTNMIPYRFSFLFSFVLLYMAYRAYLARERFRLWQIGVSGLLALLILAAGEHQGDPVFVAYNLGFFILYIGVLLAYVLLQSPSRGKPEAVEADEAAEAVETVEPAGEAGDGAVEGPAEEPEAESGPDPEALRFLERRRRITSAVLLAVMGVEIAANIANFGRFFPGTDVSAYPRGKENTVAAVAAMKELEADTPFYRAETSHSQALNDGALLGYNGISTFTSSANVRVTNFMRALGYGAQDNYNRYYFEESSPVSNLFLDLKYMIEREGIVKENDYFSPVRTFGNVTLLQNNAYLPLGFLADSALGEVEFDLTADPFLFQNDLLTAASGVEAPVWHLVPTSGLTIDATGGPEITPSPASRYCYYTCDGESGAVTFTYTANRAGLFCVHLNLSARNSFRLYKNDVELANESYSLPQMLSVAQVEPGDEVRIRMSCGANTRGSMVVKAAILDKEVFDRAYGVLSASTLELTDFDTTSFEGVADCDRDGLLYISVADDGNWRAQVDGEDTDPVLVGGCMMALPVTAGLHTVSFRYENAAFSLGWKITLACAAVFLAVSYLAYRPKLKLKRGKHQRRGRKG